MSASAPDTARLSAADTWQRARRVVPRGVSSGHRVGWDQVFVRAQGAYIWDADGRGYLDYINSWGPIVLGHCDPRVNHAVFEAVSTCDLTGVGPQAGEMELAETICELVPSADKVAFCSSGTDATMHAVHIARAATGRRLLLKFHGSYHGWSDVLAVGSSRTDLTAGSPLNTPNSAGLHPGATDDVIVVEWNDVVGLRAAFAEHGAQIAAAFAEPYVHSYGCVPADPGFLELLRELCSANGSVLVFDEIKTGFRASLGGYQSLAGVTPDLTAFAKALANGFSIAAVAGADSLMGHLGAYSRREATIDGTYNANPYSIAAARATLAVMKEEDTVSTLWSRGDRLRSGIQSVIDELQVEATVTGLGSEWTLYFLPQAPRSFREAMGSDADRYAVYHSSLLEQGIVEPAFATGDRRLNASTTVDDIDRTIEANHVALQRAFR